MSLFTASEIGKSIAQPIFAREELRSAKDFSVTKQPNYVRCMIDSGIFASWRNGHQIDIYEYIDYIKRNLPWIEQYACLDKIPGEPGRHPTKAEVEDSAKVSYENQQIMKQAGLNPIPIYHQGESLSHLERYLDDGELYIGISPQEDNLSWRGPDPTVWLDKVWTRITTSDGTPIVKTHGFGVMGPKLLRRYPWHSVDATSFTWQANFGALFIPKYINGEPDYLSDPNYVHVSENTQRKATIHASVKDKSKIQFGNLSRAQQDQVIHFVTEICGLTMVGVRYDDNERRKEAIMWWRKVVEALEGNTKFRYRRKGLWT